MAREKDMDLYRETKIRNRVFEVTHKPSGRRFHIQGHPNIHKWWADEIISTNGKTKMVPTPVVDWNSKKRLYVLLDRWIRDQQKAEERVQVRKPKGGPAPRTPELILEKTPGPPVKLRRTLVSTNKYKFTDPLGREFYIGKKSKSWYVWELHGLTLAQGIEDYDQALAELVAWLSTDEYKFKLAPGVERRVTIYVSMRADGRFVITSIRADNEQLLYATEPREEVEAEVALQREQLLTMGYSDEDIDVKRVEEGIIP
jgi:hypothetical protein